MNSRHAQEQKAAPMGAAFCLFFLLLILFILQRITAMDKGLGQKFML